MATKLINIECISHDGTNYSVINLNISINPMIEKYILNNKFVYNEQVDNIIGGHNKSINPSNTAISGWHKTEYIINKIKLIWYTNYNYEYRLEDKHQVVEICLNDQLIKRLHHIDDSYKFVYLLNYFNSTFNVYRFLYENLGSNYINKLIVDNKIYDRIISEI
jgi:hypothetical protein